MKALDIFALTLGLALGLVEAYRRNGDGARAQRAAKRLAASGNIEEMLVLYVDVSAAVETRVSNAGASLTQPPF